MKIKFLGATGTVTGSRYLLSYKNKKILVDCGLFQGYKELRLRNWEPFPIDPKKIDVIVLTHAHIDHSGYLPALVKRGFRGKIYCSEETKALCGILLPDSGHLQEEEARFANKRGYSKHKPALPLYTQEDAVKVIPYLFSIPTGKSCELDEGLSFCFRRVGHIIGASCIIFTVEGKKLTFSGDVGRMHDAMMVAPRNIQSTDYLVIESTYGNRLHETSDPQEQIRQIINDTVKRGGVIVVPAFAVGRTQLLLYYLYRLLKEKLIPSIPVFIDSPTAVEATNFFRHFTKSTRFSKEEAQAICDIAICTHSSDESKQIDKTHSPKIIISASGMATGGRVLHHLKVFGSDARNTILLTGYQTPGTRGSRLQAGEDEIKILGEMVPIRAKVETLLNISAHADYEELLLWMSHFKAPPKKVFITHGELEASLSLKAKIEKQLGWNCLVPKYLYEEALWQ